MSPIKDRVFWITGAASGIGRHLCQRALSGDAKVVAADINTKGLEDASRGWPTDRFALETLDVTNHDAWQESLERALKRFGRIDVLCNVAGYLRPGYASESSPEDTHRHIDINLKGVIFGTQCLGREMASRDGGGHIITIASMAALSPIPGLALYSASKYAVRSFTLSAAAELRPKGVAVTVICPDAVKTPMLDLQREYEQASITFSGSKLLSVEDVGDAVFDRALRRRPLEIHLPWTRGILARLGDRFPGLGFAIAPLLTRKGRAKRLSYEGSGKNQP